MKATIKRSKKSKQKLPPGWTQERLRKLAEHYENQTGEEQVAEHEAAFRAKGHTVMVVPNDLVPEVRKLIARRRIA